MGSALPMSLVCCLPISQRCLCVSLCECTCMGVSVHAFACGYECGIDVFPPLVLAHLERALS